MFGRLMLYKRLFVDAIDSRDWGNIDYCIYCLETRRADNMKEALQLTDSEKRNDRIVEAVAMANAEICRTIRENITELQNDMRVCFNILSDQIAQQTMAVIASTARMRKELSVQSAYLSKLASEVRLNNALQEKANVTSERLAVDIEYIKEYELN